MRKRISCMQQNNARVLICWNGIVTMRDAFFYWNAKADVMTGAMRL